MRRPRSADSCRSVSVGDVVPVDPHRPGRRPVERADQVQHRRLARAGRADDREQLAVLDGQVEPSSGGDAAGVGLRDPGSSMTGAHDGTTTSGRRRPAPDTSTRPSANRPVSTATIRVRADLDHLQAVAAFGQREQGRHRHGEHVRALRAVKATVTAARPGRRRPAEADGHPTAWSSLLRALAGFDHGLDGGDPPGRLLPSGRSTCDGRALAGQPLRRRRPGRRWPPGRCRWWGAGRCRAARGVRLGG